jgi:hypothetical protein
MKNAKSKRTIFEEFCKEEYPDLVLEMNASGKYNKEVALLYAAFCKAFDQSFSFLKDQARPFTSYIVGSTSNKKLKFGRLPRIHKTLGKAEAEAQRLLTAYPREQIEDVYIYAKIEKISRAENEVVAPSNSPPPEVKPYVEDYTAGPFGHYPDACTGKLLNLMCKYERIPLSKVENVLIGDRIITNTKGEAIGEYKWFDNDMAYFRWFGEFECYSKQHMGGNAKGERVPMFRIQLSNAGHAGFIIDGKEATADLNKFVGVMLTNSMTLPAYWIHKEAGAFFQSGSDNIDGENIYVEFWKPKGAQAWVDHLNEHFKPDLSFDENLILYCKTQTKTVEEIRAIYMK